MAQQAMHAGVTDSAQSYINNIFFNKLEAFNYQNNKVDYPATEFSHLDLYNMNQVTFNAESTPHRYQTLPQNTTNDLSRSEDFSTHNTLRILKMRK